MRASNQWAFRPADERFWNLTELHEATIQHRHQAVTATIKLEDVRVDAVGDSLQLSGRTGIPAKFTHWSFGQLASLAQAPGSYLRTLPATLAAQNLNHGLKNRENGESHILMTHRKATSGGLTTGLPETYRIRAFTSDRYSRIWNHEIVERLIELPSEWRVPPARPASTDPRSRPATEADLLDRKGMLSIKVGDMIAPAGLYASEEDMFVFMVDESRPIYDGTPEGLARGFFITNSEVGKASFRVTTFLYRHCCGNHIIWDATQLEEIRIRHVGTAPTKAFAQLNVELIKYAEASAVKDEVKIRIAKSFKIAANVDDVIDAVFQKKIISRSNAQAAFELCKQNADTDGDPRSAWGLSQGITRLSQEQVNADQRVVLDRAAGKVLQMAF
jgi:hypothetical protein